MSVRVYTSVDLEPIECCNCAVIFGVPPQWNINRRETKQTFYCPNGHPQSYTKSDADRLREQLEAEKKKLANAQFELIKVYEGLSGLSLSMKDYKSTINFMIKKDNIGQ